MQHTELEGLPLMALVAFRGSSRPMVYLSYYHETALWQGDFKPDASLRRKHL